MPVETTVEQLLESGAHFGHRTSLWNPKMRGYIFTQRNGIHIIDLEQTAAQAAKSCKFIADTVALGKSVLFVGTKRQAHDVIKQEAERSGQFYVVNRWLGGMLTNFQTIKKSIDRLDKLDALRANQEELSKITKKEALNIDREIKKLESSLGGIRKMNKLPGALFIIDPKNENIAKREANKLGIPVIAVCDTNCDPDGIDYLIPGNDDALKAIQLFAKTIAEACMEGLARREQALREKPAEDAKAAREKHPAVKEVKVGGRGRAYTAKKPEEKEDVSEGDINKYSSAKVEETEEGDEE